MDEFDYVIVGAGSAGSVLAARLSEDANCTVCVLEAGPRDWHPMIHIPVGWMKLMKNPSFNWMFEAEGSDWTGGRKIAVPRGKTLGGSSSINGNIFNRGAPSDFDHWAQRGNSGWSYADILPLFRRMEDWRGPNPDSLRGQGGPLKVTPSPWAHPLCDAFLASAESLGIPRNPDYNGRAQFGAAYAQRTISNGRRQSAAQAFLRPAMKRPNLDIRCNAQAMGVLFEGKRATGISYQRGGHKNQVKARREVILAGGVINSPHLIDTFNQKSKGLALGAEVAKWLIGKPSILGLPSTACYAFAKSDPILEDSDLQITFMPASYKEGHQSELDDQPGMTLAAWQQRPESVGCVLARTADPFDKPLIQPNYLSTAKDRQVLLAGLKLVRALMRAAPMQPYFAGELYPGEDVQSDDDLLATARERGTTTFHMMGTCRMGPSQDQSAVVDPSLRVHGMDGLRVADASIMPTMPAANTNAASMMIGEKAADLIKAE